MERLVGWGDGGVWKWKVRKGVEKKKEKERVVVAAIDACA